ncbi:MAG: histidine kinase dimerization/phospho-acceptor domain-containing protein [bacterium]
MARDEMSGTRDSPLEGRAAAAYLREQALETEERVARIRVWVAVWAFPTGSYLAFAGQLPLLTSPWLYVGVLAGLLVYALVYRARRIHRRFDLHSAVRWVSLLDLVVVLFVVMNTGGLRGPYWGVVGVLLLLYVMRFGFDWMEAVGTVAIVGGTIATSYVLDPVPIGTLVNAVFGIALSLVLITLVGYILLERERRAVEEAFAAEIRSISRIVNTVQHEVNNPLAIASGNMELLRNRREGMGEGPYLERIEGALERIQHAVGRLRDLDEVPEVEGEGLLERYGERSKEEGGG